MAAQTCLHPEIACDVLADARAGRLSLAAGIGTAVVGEPRNGVEIAGDFGLTWANDSDRQDHANWGWPMRQIDRWCEHIPMKGMQGLWTWPQPEDALPELFVRQLGDGS